MAKKTRTIHGFRLPARDNQDADVGVRVVVAQITRMLRKADLRHVLLGAPAIVAIIIPSEADHELYMLAAAEIAKPTVSNVTRGRGYETFRVDAGRLKTRTGYSDSEPEVKSALRRRDQVWLTVRSERDIPAYYRTRSDIVLTIPPIGPDEIRMAFAMATAWRPPAADVKALVGVQPEILSSVVRHGVSGPATMARLKKIALVVGDRAEIAGTRGPTLDDLHGLGEAGEWGRDLAADLADYKAGKLGWDDVDRGVLLSGPPGCGKTTMAMALGRTCRVPVFIHSLARWQAKGYMNDLLKAMRGAFAEAQTAAPSILFLDELDSFGDRETLTGHNREYCTEVINAFLECMDGAEKRTGVVIVGATNNPSRIDGAIRRAGRLDRHIAIPLPSEAARDGILRYHLGKSSASASFDLSGVVRRTEGKSGADLEKLVRDGRRLARKARRDVTVADLAAALPPLARVDRERHWRTCVHEAGHAVAAHAEGVEVLLVHAPRELAVDTHESGGTSTEASMTAGTRKTWNARIRTCLSGLAAEQIVLGDYSDGGGGEGGDLERASLAAAALEAACGLGTRLVVTSAIDADQLRQALRTDAALQRSVDEVLKAAFAEAVSLMTGRKETVLSIAHALEEHERVGTPMLERLLAGPPPAASTEPNTTSKESRDGRRLA